MCSAWELGHLECMGVLQSIMWEWTTHQVPAVQQTFPYPWWDPVPWTINNTAIMQNTGVPRYVHIVQCHVSGVQVEL